MVSDSPVLSYMGLLINKEPQHRRQHTLARTKGTPKEPLTFCKLPYELSSKLLQGGIGGYIRDYSRDLLKGDTGSLDDGSY